MSFAETLAEKHKTQSGYYTTVETMRQQFKNDAEAIFRARYPKRKKIDLDLIKDVPEYINLRTDAIQKADALTAQTKNRIAELETELNRLAEEEEIPITDTLNLCHTSYSSTYGSQGFGASRYAENAAALRADHARMQGVIAEVQPVGDMRRDRTYGIQYQDYGVYVNTSEVGWEMINRRPALTLKDWLKTCWKRGVNPRVYNPMLPAGLEERFGIDYRGNDVEPTPKGNE